MTERTQRMRIEDLASVGEELSEEHLRLVSGAAGKKSNSGPGQRYDGTSTGTGATTVIAEDLSRTCEDDSDID